jgi:NAD(P)-dependent dehydrogenase (short-subunit alcohol dehydrogenase family)
MTSRIAELFSLKGRVAVVTGGAGLLGTRHRVILESAGATVVSLDLLPCDDGESILCDITDSAAIESAIGRVIEKYGAIDILVNNAARNPKVEDGLSGWCRFEDLDRQTWDADIAVGLTGAFLVCQTIGHHMVERNQGVIVNVCSDLSVIAPNQHIYRQEGVAEHDQPIKAVSYSVVKHGLLGLTKYLAAYWAPHNIRVNAISPGGVSAAGQNEAFVTRISSLIPLGRMARVDELEGAILFLCSDASSYLTGHNLVVDGGRTIW